MNILCLPWSNLILVLLNSTLCKRQSCKIKYLNCCQFFRKLRTKPTTPNLVNICINLVASYFFFIVGVDRAENKSACDAMTFFLHYFTLASLSWMCVNAFQMYKAFTQVIKVCLKLIAYSRAIKLIQGCGPNLHTWILYGPDSVEKEFKQARLYISGPQTFFVCRCRKPVDLISRRTSHANPFLLIASGIIWKSPLRRATISENR